MSDADHRHAADIQLRRLRRRASIQRVAEELLDSLGLADAISTSRSTRQRRSRAPRVEVGDAISIRAESGAFEDTRRPRQQSEVATATSLGRVLLRVRIGSTADSATRRPTTSLTLAQVAAWETYCVGRLERLGIEVNQQRWRYNFRNRHGFTDAGRRGVQPPVGERRPDVGRARGNLLRHAESAEDSHS